MSPRLAAVALIAALAALPACDINEYCLDCPTGDDDGDGGARRDGGIDAGDGGTPHDACIITGTEVCNGLDDDCDGTVDEEVPQVGETCGTNVGQCTVGVLACTAGTLRCSGVAASAEACDDIDNDCDGVVDDGNPGGGVPCGSDLGECVAGITACTAGGVLQCIGAIGTPGANPEICDGRDNDCDNAFDEDLPTMGPCGTSGNDGTGLCELGVLTCVGGAPVCLGERGPQFELCDDLDQDCDGDPTNGYDLDNDARNCGACGVSCVGTIENATAICVGGVCAIGTCDPGYYDSILPVHPGPDCLYACNYRGPIEACNGVDDDCDGIIDENTNPPAICSQLGACAGTVAVCTPAGFDCPYSGDVSLDDLGNLQQETQCDGVDNDCDGRVDEGDPQVFHALSCHDGGVGECRSFGAYACDPADEDGPPVCVIDSPGLPAPGVEVCNGRDDDCDGVVDNGIATGALQAWVQIAGGSGPGSKQIMQHEASRPDATAGAIGSLVTYPCSRGGVQPWTFVTQPQAQAACEAIGARLCSEQEWHQACSVVTPSVYPIVQEATGNAPIFIEAEDYHQLTPQTSGGVLRTWVPDYTSTFSGISALRASPNTGGLVNLANAPAQAPRLDYQVTFTQSGNHYVWVRLYSPNGSDDRVHVGISATPGSTAPTRSLVTSVNGSWHWRRTDSISVTLGTRMVSVYMQEDGVKVDAILITRSTSTTAPTTTTGNGGDWAFATNPDTYVGTTCNGEDLDTRLDDPLDPATLGDQDDILPTGSLAGCFANGAGTNDAYDMSGNVKEWTLARTPGANPIRGGASNNLANGISCGLAFTLASDDFFFNNVGFRCCRTVP